MADDCAERNMAAVIAEELLKVIEEDAVHGGTMNAGRRTLRRRFGDSPPRTYSPRNDVLAIPGV